MYEVKENSMAPAYRFSRAGKIYKELDADEGHLIAGFLRTGVIGANDDYWMPGMTEWKKVFTHDWTIAKPTPAPAPAPSTAANAAEAAQAAAASAAVAVTRSHICECTTCKKGFATPGKAISGYSVIGQAAKYFGCGIGLMIITYAINDLIREWTFRLESRFSILLYSTIIGVITLAALCLFLMALFELIAAAVTHGIYRAAPERCPYCNSTTFTKRI